MGQPLRIGERPAINDAALGEQSAAKMVSQKGAARGRSYVRRRSDRLCRAASGSRPACPGGQAYRRRCHRSVRSREWQGMARTCSTSGCEKQRMIKIAGSRSPGIAEIDPAVDKTPELRAFSGRVKGKIGDVVEPMVETRGSDRRVRGSAYRTEGVLHRRQGATRLAASRICPRSTTTGSARSMPRYVGKAAGQRPSRRSARWSIGSCSCPRATNLTHTVLLEFSGDARVCGRQKETPLPDGNGVAIIVGCGDRI